MSGALQAVFQNQRSFITVPGAPTIGTATQTGPTTATVVYTAPASDGGTAITSYTATSSPAGGTGTLSQAGSGTITVTGLTTNTSYTFTVTATNAVGTGPASAASNSVTPIAPTTIGEAFGGGFYAGQIGVSGTATHYLIIGPVASAESNNRKYKNATTATAGADSVIDGPQNTADMVADGSSTVYPCAHFCNDLVIGGFSDWYMPAKNELEVCYYNLKPTTTSNVTSVGTNANSVPERTSNYTTGTPARTSVTDFRSTGTEFFSSTHYWSSTEVSATNARTVSFSDGSQNSYPKSYENPVRAIRRIPV